VPLQRLVLPPNEQDFSVIDDDGADTDDRPLRVLPGIVHVSTALPFLDSYSPMTFTMTRFRRWPSNSA